MKLKVLEKPSVIKSWLFPLTFSCFWKFRLLLYVFKKSCNVCKSKRFQITRDMQIYLQSKLALSVLLRMVHLQISHIIYSTLSLSFSFVRFEVIFEIITKTYCTVFDKDSRWLFKIKIIIISIFQSVTHDLCKYVRSHQK